MRKDAQERHSEIEPADVDSALALLASEHEVGRSGRSSAYELVEDLLIAGGLFALPVGLIVVWSQLWLGVALILCGLVCFGVYVAMPSSGLFEESKRIQSKLDSVESLRVGTWTRSEHWSLTILTLGSIAIWFGGMAWLVWAQIGNGEPPIAPILLAALGIFAFWILVAIDQVENYRYYTRVERALESIRKQADVTEPGTVMVSEAELQVLSQAEAHHLRRAVDESVKQLPDTLGDSYAVSLAPEALDSLDVLAEQSPEDWLQITEAITSLQVDPRPTTARSVAEIPDAVGIVAGDHGVEYRIDEDLHRIYVVAIETQSESQADDA